MRSLEVSEIIEGIDMVEYISQYVDLEQRGREWWGLSCFNEERTPSFSVDPSKGAWMDFSSGRGGNLIQFVIDHDRVSVPEAIRILKRYANLPEEEGEANQPPKRLEASKVAKRYRPAARKPPAMTAKPMPENCMSEYEFRPDKFKPWLDEGISLDTLRRFQVRYDAFDDRIVFPIRDYAGRIVSVSGRTLDPDFKSKGIRKYTYLQKIGTLDTLYAFSDNREYILESGEILLFEGAKSCMKAWEWGVCNTAALLTSHLSLPQLRFLIQFCNLNQIRAVFALDSDVDIRKDDNIRRLRGYARVEWVKNRDGLLQPKDSPTDHGVEVFATLYQRRERI